MNALINDERINDLRDELEQAILEQEKIQSIIEDIKNELRQIEP